MNDTLDERLRLFTDQLLIENTAVWANGYPNAIVGFIIVDESRMPDRLWRVSGGTMHRLSTKRSWNEKDFGSRRPGL